MNKQTFSKAAAVFASAVLTASMAVPAFAGTQYTPVAGTQCTFNKFLVMDAGDTVPNATFSFRVTPGAARSADTSDNQVMQVLPGVGTPTIADVTFAPTDSTSTDTGTYIDLLRTEEDRTGVEGTAGNDTVHFDSGEKFAVKTATVDFSSIEFDEPGIYRYIITEASNTGHAAAGIIHDTDVDRVLDVYVTDDGNGTLVVSAYVLHTNDGDVVINNTMGSQDVAEAGAALADKTDGFTNELTTKDLKLEKEVSGNQASRDKYFEFTATCTNVNDNDTFVVSIAADTDDSTNDGSADATSGSNSATIAANAGKTNPTMVTGAQLKAGVKFYLQHGQSVVIRGLPLTANYTVTENAEDYASAVKSGDTNSGTIGTVAGQNKMATAGFTNTRNGIVPTGVFLSVGVPAIIILCAAGAITVVLVSKKRREATEED